MNAEEILQYCLDNLKGVVMVESWGERGIYYNPEGLLQRGVYILTMRIYIIEKTALIVIDM